jgi:hypothetical protein
MGADESDAMWKLYASQGGSIALQSTYRRLREVLPPEVLVGKIRYIDYRRTSIPELNALHRCMHKRKAFAHEKELRAVVFGDLTKLPGARTTEQGVWIPVSMRRLLSAIHVAPSEPLWIHELMESLMKRYQLAVPVRRSSLDDTAPFAD